LSHQPTGVYDYDLPAGVELLYTRGTGYSYSVLLPGDHTTTRIDVAKKIEALTGSFHHFQGHLVHVNTIDSPFGSGWGIAGLEELVENPDGSLLLVDGDGSELLFGPPTAIGQAYAAPPGDFSVLNKLGDGTYQRKL